MEHPPRANAIVETIRSTAGQPTKNLPSQVSATDAAISPTIGLGSPRWHAPVVATLLALAAIAAYHNSFHGPLVFDDRTWIVDNQTIRQLWPPGPVLFPPSTALVGGRPILSLTLATNYALGGTDVWGYHAVNLGIHVLAAWTLFGVVRRSFLLPTLYDRFGAAATPLALTVALLWAVHPLQTSAVTYVVQRNESLVGLFYLLTLYCVIRGATTNGHAFRTRVWFATALVACLLGMLTKEVMVAAPVVVLLYDRTFLSGTFRQAIRQRWGLYIALFATWIAVVWVLISTDFHSGTTGFGVKQFTGWSYLLTQPGVIVHYLQQSFWPADLSLDYGWPPATKFGEIVPAGLFVAALLGLTWWALVKRPTLGFVGACFFLILAPTSSFVPIQDAAFDHRMYLPLASVMMLAVVAAYAIGRSLLRRCSPTLTRHRRFVWIASLAAIGVPTIALAWATVERNNAFRSEISILEDTCEKRPNNARALNNLGEALNRLGRGPEAIVYYKRAMDADPKYILPINNLASASSERGDLATATAMFRQALDIEPDDPWVNINLATVLARQNQLDEAAARCRSVLRDKPNFAEAHGVMARVFARQGRIDLAESQYRAALELKAEMPEAHAELAELLMRQGKPADAIPHLRQAADAEPLNADARDRLAVALAMSNRNEEARAEFHEIFATAPNHVIAHYHFGFALARQGEWAAAIAQWREAERLQSDAAPVVKQLAWALATCPDSSLRSGNEAVKLAERAMKLSHDLDPAILDALAAANAETGRFDKAVEFAEQAMLLAARQNNSDLADRIADRLSLYLTRTPYREMQPSGP